MQLNLCPYIKSVENHWDRIPFVSECLFHLHCSLVQRAAQAEDSNSWVLEVSTAFPILIVC